MKRLALLVLLSGSLLCSCQSVQTERQAGTVPSIGLTEEEALAIAKHAVTQNDTWADRATYKAKRQGDGTWLIGVQRIVGHDEDGKPRFTPGGHRVIRIDTNGNVTAYSRGA